MKNSGIVIKAAHIYGVIKMLTFCFCKADPTVSDQEIKSINIQISDELPYYKSQSIEEVEQFHSLQANELSELLFNSLPQGTYDLLLFYLFQKKLKKYPPVYRGLTDH